MGLRLFRMEGSMNINGNCKAGGVSRATVSPYLNNGYVSDEKKKSAFRR